MQNGLTTIIFYFGLVIKIKLYKEFNFENSLFSTASKIIKEICSNVPYRWRLKIFKENESENLYFDDLKIIYI